MTERLGKRVSRSITFYPTPEDNQLLEELDRRVEVQQITFSELCKIALRQFVEAGQTASVNPYTVTFTADDRGLQQLADSEMLLEDLSFSDWVKRELGELHTPAPPTDPGLASRVQFLEQAVAQLQNQPTPLTRQEVEQMMRQHLQNQPTPLTRQEVEQMMRQHFTPPVVKETPPPPPPKPVPATDPLIAELSALLLDDF